MLLKFKSQVCKGSCSNCMLASGQQKLEGQAMLSVVLMVMVASPVMTAATPARNVPKELRRLRMMQRSTQQANAESSCAAAMLAWMDCQGDSSLCTGSCRHAACSVVSSCPAGSTVRLNAGNVLDFYSYEMPQNMSADWITLTFKGEAVQHDVQAITEGMATCPCKSQLQMSPRPAEQTNAEHRCSTALDDLLPVFFDPDKDDFFEPGVICTNRYWPSACGLVSSCPIGLNSDLVLQWIKDTIETSCPCTGPRPIYP